MRFSLIPGESVEAVSAKFLFAGDEVEVFGYFVKLLTVEPTRSGVRVSYDLGHIRPFVKSLSGKVQRVTTVK